MPQSDILLLFFSVSAIVLSALFSLGAIWYSREQVKKANQSVKQSQHLAKFDTVMHFTDRFFDLLRDGKYADVDMPLHLKVTADKRWANQFWSLHATEFYFYHHRLLPEFMYSLWMVELAKMYRDSKGDEVWKLHKEYLNTYSLNYQEMCDFYETIHMFSKSEIPEDERNKKIREYVIKWLEEHPLT